MGENLKRFSGEFRGIERGIETVGMVGRGC
jgi:hypothetical protein